MTNRIPLSGMKFTGAHGRAAVAGLLAALFALAVGELLAGLIGGAPSLVVSVGSLIIDISPAALEDFAIGVFGTNDKLALVIGIVVVSGGVGAVIGVAALARPMIGVIGFVAFGVLGAYAATRDPLATPGLAVIAAAVATYAGIAALRIMLRPGLAGTSEAPAPGRRAFLGAAGALTSLAVASAVGGRVLLERAAMVASGRDEVELPDPETPAEPLTAAASLDVPGISSIVTPNDIFYRIDTALVTPRVDLDEWRLKITGMVDRPYELNFAQLLGQPMREEFVTLACVSNQVGGNLIGNAKWLGTPLADVLNRAGVKDGATQIVGRSVDGFTVGFPTEVAFDGRQALVAVGMNGEPLPFDHGFPARLVVAGLYGYVSATKWLAEIELTTWDAFDAYWIPKGWAKEAPIKTQSRIDVPAEGQVVRPGPRPIAGVAWAQNRGIEKVEVQVGEGPWGEAQLSEPISKNTWRQWVYDWNATAGVHIVRVRATDSTGTTQTSDIEYPRPDGATGYHTRPVFVSEAG